MVSVVMMAFAAAVPASRVASFAWASMATPFLILSMGSCMPMTPVEPTRTDSAGMPRAADAASAVSLQ